MIAQPTVVCVTGTVRPVTDQTLQIVSLASHTHQEQIVTVNLTGGQDCEVYYGVCAPTCEGCTGPTASDCVNCREFATRGVDGACDCLEDPEYGGDANCSDVSQDYCHEACLW
jgi:hypothetical protein